MPTYNYLLGPNFQAEDESGKPLVGGYVEVYLHNTTTQYVTKKDFNGTNNEFRVVLNSLGMAVIIADVANAYDVYCYNRFGSLKWSRQNVNTIGDSGGGGSSVPLVRVKYQNGAWSKISGDDGFIKPNRWGVDSLFLPESCWWSIGVGISVANNTPRDLIQHLQMKYEWNSYISMDVPPLTYEAHLPAMTYEADFTRANTNNRYTTSLYKKDGATEDWLSVALTAYHDTLPNDLEWALWMNIFKVRDA